MKRFYASVVAVLLLFNMLLPYAKCTDTTVERIDYDDGSYAIVTTTSSGATRAQTADSKQYTYYDPLGRKCFFYILYATFTYDGTTSSADSSTAEAGIYRDWSVDSHSEYTSGRTAYGNATFSSPSGGTRPVALTLTCSANGRVE